jgi:hypothetical protein
MDKVIAAELVDAIQECQKAIDRAEVVARGIPDQQERDRVRKAIMQASGMLYTEVVLGISVDYPDLSPLPKS